MSAGKVDVLLVLDALLAFASTGVERDDPARQMIEAGHEARAAVAELIAAAKDAEKCVASRVALFNDPENYAHTEFRARNRLRAALARVQP